MASSISFSTANPNSSVVIDECGNVTSVCNEQECLLRPRFFCGQLLNDQDLTALLEWAQNKRQLDRHKHGWGVVNGLQIQCDHSNRSRVIVSTGYAVDPCGNDIVVCEDSMVDFSNVCPVVEPSCKEFDAPEPPPNPEFLGLELPPGTLSVVDLYVYYDEEGELPLPALGRGACSERDACEYSRIRENYRFDWCEADSDESLFKRRLAEWEKGFFSECRSLVDSFDGRFPEPEPTQLDEIKGWLMSWLEQHPMHEFCFVRDAIEQLSFDSGQEYDYQAFIAELARLMFWMVQDCRNAYVLGRPILPIEDAGVPIARITLHRRNESGATCNVIHIEDFPKPRRELMLDPWPAPMGWVNLGQYIWRHAEEVCAELHDLGLEPVRIDLPVPTTIEELQDYLVSKTEEMRIRLFWPIRCHDIEQENPDELWKPDNIGVAVIRDPGSPLGNRVFAFFSVHRDRWGKVGSEFERKPTEGKDIAVDREKAAAAAAAAAKKKAAAEAARKEAVEGREKAAAAGLRKAAVVTKERSVAKAVTAERAAMVKTAVIEKDSADMLGTINGIGEKRAFKLRQNGIDSFEKLAATNIKKLQEVFPRGVKESELKGWLKQAKKLAK